MRRGGFFAESDCRILAPPDWPCQPRFRSEPRGGDGYILDGLAHSSHTSIDVGEGVPYNALWYFSTLAGCVMGFQPEPFGKYYLLDKIAVGGMAEIFKAKQFGPGGFEKVLVIKRILSHLGEDDEFIQMFRDEAMISSTLSHSNIIHIYDFGKVRNNYYIAMEYCEGRDLKTIMKKCQEVVRPLPIEHAVYVIHEVCKALDYAHRKKDSNNAELNILHRDVSPSNIMISYEEGKVKLADFGIAKAQNASYKTKAGVLKGKFEYMSPEQASGLPADRRSDIFAVGICFYELLTRRRLFKSDSDLKTLELIRNPYIPPPSHLNPQVREELDTIVMKALARRPEDRYQEAWQLQHDLREFMRGCSPPTSPDMIAQNMASFLREIFDKERRIEQERLELATRIAREYMSNVNAAPQLELDDEPYEGGGPSQVTSGPTFNTLSRPPGSASGGTHPGTNTAVRLMIQEKQKTRDGRPLVVGGVAGALVVGAGVLMLSSSDPVPQTTSSVQGTASGPQGQPLPLAGQGAGTRRGVLRLNIEPYGSRIFVNGRPLGVSPLVSDEIPVGSRFELKVERDGYQRYLDNLLVEPGEIRDITLMLKPEGREAAPVPQPPPQKKPTPAELPPVEAAAPQPGGRLEFTSSPSRASVLVDGRTYCTTPCSMDSGQASASYQIEFVLEGYASSQARVRFPSAGTQPVSATLSPVEKGFLTLSIKDQLSAELIVDGQNKGYNAFFNRIALPAGKHQLILRNQVAGLQKELTIEVEPGKEVKLQGVELDGH